MIVFIRIGPIDVEVYDDRMLLRVKNRLFRPYFGITPILCTLT